MWPFGVSTPGCFGSMQLRRELLIKPLWSRESVRYWISGLSLVLPEGKDEVAKEARELSLPSKRKASLWVFLMAVSSGFCKPSVSSNTKQNMGLGLTRRNYPKENKSYWFMQCGGSLRALWTPLCPSLLCLGMFGWSGELKTATHGWKQIQLSHYAQRS